MWWSGAKPTVTTPSGRLGEEVNAIEAGLGSGRRGVYVGDAKMIGRLIAFHAGAHVRRGWLISVLAFALISLLAVALLVRHLQREPSPLAARTLQGRFYDATGLHLARDRSYHDRYIKRFLPHERRSAQRRFGDFVIYVVQPQPHGAKQIDRMLRSNAREGHAGLYWSKRARPPGWIAQRRYRQNVIVVFTAPSKGSLSKRSQRLARVLEHVAR